MQFMSGGINMVKNKGKISFILFSIILSLALMFGCYKVTESKELSLPTWSQELILTFNGQQYNVTNKKTNDVIKKIGNISYHGKISAVFDLYSIKNANDYNSIAVKTKEGYLIATIKEISNDFSNNIATVTTESKANKEVTENPVEVVNTIENNGNPIQLVINVGSLNAPIYVKLGKTTIVNEREISLFIYLKNKDLLPYQMANQPRMIITAEPSSWEVHSKNPLVEPNSFYCAIQLQNLSSRTGDITIERIYDKNKKQILAKPITFKIELSDDVK